MNLIRKITLLLDEIEHKVKLWTKDPKPAYRQQLSDARNEIFQLVANRSTSPVLMWDKPEKVMSTESWKSISADSAPPGVYCPNMSQEDMMRWKAKLVGHTKGRPQVEIRRNGMLIIVNLGTGYKYKNYYKPENTQGINLHIAMNGPQQMTFQELSDMQAAIQEAREVLESLPKTTKTNKDPFKRTRAALEVYDAGKDKRDELWNSVNTNEDLIAVEDRCLEAANVVREAFYKDTRTYNSRDNVFLMGIEDIRRVSLPKNLKGDTDDT